MTNTIKILDTNKYSINVKDDYLDIKKINSYYPTYKNMLILDKFLNIIKKQNQGSVILSGAYGTGKSYLISVLLNILSGKYKDYDYFIEKAKLKYNISATMDNFLDKKHFIVFADSNYKDFSKAILSGIHNTIKQENLDIKLSTTFEIIEEKIKNWKNNHTKTYNRMIKYLKNNNNKDLFFQYLTEKDDRVLKLFDEIYKELFAGETFNDLEKTSNIQTLLKDIENQVLTKGYSGVIYIFDEFGRYLETGIDDIDVKEIQDLAEYCNNENTSNIFLITHKNLFQYTGRIKSKQNQDEWEKVSGRFLKEHLTYEKVNTLDILSDILKKNDYSNFRSKNELEFKSKESKLQDLDLNVKDITTATQRYYPLDYITATILPDLSQKLAQNERTLFAFICGDEEKGLKNIMSLENNLFITLDRLYDYFEENFKFLELDSNEYKIYKIGSHLLNNLDEDEILEKKFIKILTLIYIYNNFSELEPSKEVMKYLLNLDDISKIQEKLMEKNYINYRRHYNHYKLVEDNDINIDKEITEYREKTLKRFNYIDTLERNIPLSTYYPLKYNDLNKITRYMERYYVDASDVSRIEEIKKNHDADGKIIYLLNLEKNENYNEIKDILKDKDFIIISSNDDIEILNEINELEVIDRLLVMEKYKEKSILQKELLVYKEEIIRTILNSLKKYFENGIINNYKKYTSKNMLEITNKYLTEKYTNYFPINYELINKHNLSSPMKKSRYEILKKLKSKIPLDKKYFNETKAENSVARILLSNTGLYSSITYEINIENTAYKYIYNSILEDVKIKKLNLGDIYDKYTSNLGNYGIRRGIFTFILGILFIKNYQNLGIDFASSGSEVEIELELLDKIEKNPKSYNISYYKLGKEEKEYLLKLSEILNIYIPQNKGKLTNNILDGLKNYVLSLPKYINGIYLKDLKKLNKLFMGIFTINNPREFLLKSMPKIYKKSNLLEVINDFESDLDEIDLLNKSFKKDLEISICNIFNDSSKNIKELILEIEKKNPSNDIERVLLNLKDLKSEEILIKLTEKIKVFSYENWRTKEDIEDFFEKLKIEVNKVYEDNISGLSERVLITYGETNIEVDMKQKESMFGKMLQSKLEATIKNMGMTLSSAEKKKILLEILLKN